MLHSKTTKNLMTPRPFPLWSRWSGSLHRNTRNSPTTFPRLLSHKRAALTSHKLCDTRERARRDTTLCAMKCELLHLSKEAPAATSQKRGPAERVPRSARFPINPVAGSQVTFYSFQFKTTETVGRVHADKEENRISGLRSKPSSVSWGQSWCDRAVIHWVFNLLAIGPHPKITWASPSDQPGICFSSHHKNLGHWSHFPCFHVSLQNTIGNHR